MVIFIVFDEIIKNYWIIWYKNNNVGWFNFYLSKFFVMFSSFFLRAFQHVELFQQIVNWLSNILVWWFFILLAYDIISFWYDLVAYFFSKKKKWLLSKMFNDFWSFIWLAMVAFFVWLFSRLIIALYFDLLWTVFSIDASAFEWWNPWAVAFVSMSALYNLIFLLVWSLIVMFSFKNKVICWIWICIWILWFIFPLIAAAISTL